MSYRIIYRSSSVVGDVSGQAASGHVESFLDEACWIRYYHRLLPVISCNYKMRHQTDVIDCADCACDVLMAGEPTAVRTEYCWLKNANDRAMAASRDTRRIELYFFNLF